MGGIGANSGTLGVWAAMGGAIYIMDGAGLTILGSGSIQNCSAAGIYPSGTSQPVACGDGIYLQGNASITFGQGDNGNSFTINNSLADETGMGINTAMPSPGPDGLNYNGSNGVLSLNVESSTLTLSGAQQFSGPISVSESGILDLSAYTNANSIDIIVGQTSTLAFNPSSAQTLSVDSLTLEPGATVELNTNAKISITTLTANQFNINMDTTNFPKGTQTVMEFSSLLPTSSKMTVSLTPSLPSNFQCNISQSKITITNLG